MDRIVLAKIDELVESHEQEMQDAFVAGWCASLYRGRASSIERSRSVTISAATAAFGDWMVYQNAWDESDRK
jgi:hypothetical protein